MMSDKYELVEYKGLERPEYILRNGKALNIYGAKKILESNQELIAKQEEEIKEFYGLCVRDGEAIIKQAAQIKQLREALTRQTELWCDLVNSGDAGNWNPEEDAEVIESRKALAATKE